jgi:hypothetical protein
MITTEGALRWYAGNPQIMVEHLERLILCWRGQSGVRVGVIPWTQPTSMVPLHGFSMYDHKAVVIGTRSPAALIMELAAWLHAHSV